MNMRKKLLILFIALFVSGCGKEDESHLKEEAVEESASGSSVNQTEEKVQEEVFNFLELSDWQFYFSSGAGGWCTFLNIDEEGTFKGNFHDSDMGDFMEEYPEGTIYYSDFSGRFSTPVKVDEYTLELTLESLEYVNPVDTEEIKDGIRYIYTDAYGLTGSDKFYLYLPGYNLGIYRRNI